jgi:hypothetical protein
MIIRLVISQPPHEGLFQFPHSNSICRRECLKGVPFRLSFPVELSILPDSVEQSNRRDFFEERSHETSSALLIRFLSHLPSSSLSDSSLTDTCRGVEHFVLFFALGEFDVDVSLIGEESSTLSSKGPIPSKRSSKFLSFSRFVSGASSGPALNAAPVASPINGTPPTSFLLRGFPWGRGSVRLFRLVEFELVTAIED